MLPGHTLLTAPAASPRKLMLFLHGILGTRANWRGIARRFVSERSDWGAVLVDLREHGESHGRPEPHTVAMAAADLGGLDAVLGAPIRGVLGHSFGGKVAAVWAREETRRGNPLTDLWVVDSAPGPRADDHEAVRALEVLDHLAALPARFETRADFVDALAARGVGDLATWLSMNLTEAEGGGLRFGPSLPAIRAMLDDYLAIDVWRFLEAPPEPLRVRFVVGERSTVFGPASRARAAAAEAATGGRVALDVVPGAGHWVHSDDPATMVRLLVEHAG